MCWVKKIIVAIVSLWLLDFLNFITVSPIFSLALLGLKIQHIHLAKRLFYQ